MIRPLREEDIPKATDMIEHFCVEMGFPFDRFSLRQFMLKCLSLDWHLVVWEEGGEFLGMGGVMLAAHYADNRDLFGVEFVWHALPQLPPTKRAKIMLKLLDSMEDFAKRANVRLIINTNAEGKSKNLSEHLIKRGYAPKEIAHVKEVW